MRPSMFAILIVAVTTACFVNPNDAQPLAEITPQTIPRACQGNIVSFNCQSDGVSALLFATGIIDRVDALTILSSHAIGVCDVTQANNDIFACKLQNNVNNLFTATLSIFVQSNQLAGTYTVSCLTSDALAVERTNVTTFIVDEDINEMVNSNFTSGCIRCESSTSMSTVEITWPPSANVEHYEIIIGVNIYHTSDDNIVVYLTEGMYIVRIMAINSCGKFPYSDLNVTVDNFDPPNMATAPTPVSTDTTSESDYTLTPSTRTTSESESTLTPSTPTPTPCDLFCVISIVFIILCALLIITVMVQCIIILKMKSPKTAIVEENVMDEVSTEHEKEAL